MRLGFSFLPIPEELMADQSLSWGAKFLFGILAKTNREEIKLSNSYLAKRMGCKAREVRYRFIELNKKYPGIISTQERRGRVNIYTLNIDLIIQFQTPEQTFTPAHGVHTTPARGVHPRKAQELCHKELCHKEETKALSLEKPLALWNERVAGGGFPQNAPNRPALAKLLPQCRQITPEAERVFAGLKKYTEEDFKKAILNYCVEILNRNPANDYSRHRFSFYEFFKQKNGFIKFLNK